MREFYIKSGLLQARRDQLVGYNRPALAQQDRCDKNTGPRGSLRIQFWGAGNPDKIVKFQLKTRTCRLVILSVPLFPQLAGVSNQFRTPSSCNDIAAAGLLKLLVGKSADRLIEEEPAIAVREFFGMDKVLLVQTFHNVHHEGRIAGQLNHVLRKLKQKPSAKDGELCQRVTLERIQ